MREKRDIVGESRGRKQRKEKERENEIEGKRES